MDKNDKTTSYESMQTTLEEILYNPRFLNERFAEKNYPSLFKEFIKIRKIVNLKLARENAKVEKETIPPIFKSNNMINKVLTRNVFKENSKKMIDNKKAYDRVYYSQNRLYKLVKIAINNGGITEKDLYDFDKDYVIIDRFRKKGKSTILRLTSKVRMLLLLKLEKNNRIYIERENVDFFNQYLNTSNEILNITTNFNTSNLSKLFLVYKNPLRINPNYENILMSQINSMFDIIKKMEGVFLISSLQKDLIKIRPDIIRLENCKRANLKFKCKKLINGELEDNCVSNEDKRKYKELIKFIAPKKSFREISKKEFLEKTKIYHEEKMVS